jgi:hypothetical protein
LFLVRAKIVDGWFRLTVSAKGAITPSAWLVKRFLRGPPFLGGSDWLGGRGFLLL